MEAFLVSSGVVAIAEIGDKTQLLALILAARYRAPVPIILGILAATVLNHTLAAWLGTLVAGWLGGESLRWGLGLSFLAMAAWALVPDKADDGPRVFDNAGAFLATLFSFFLIEIGDKTQIATVALAARFHDVALVAAGTTTGMLLADVPAVLAADFAGKRLPLRLIRLTAGAIFATLGVATLLNAGGQLLG
ncbi:MAG: TMEM165/GDT1 family protein [Magnetospirillum sp.]|nr:TMEM165/GDT1 family protein [Magnetospirillum sp.]